MEAIDTDSMRKLKILFATARVRDVKTYSEFHKTTIGQELLF